MQTNWLPSWAKTLLVGR